MTEPRDFRDLPASDGELLSAYLDGELDEATTTDLEARLEADPALAAELERTRSVVELLAGLHAEPPTGYAERLLDRLASERAPAGPAPVTSLDRAAGTSSATGWDRPPERRHASTGPGRSRRHRWARPLTAAAAVALFAVLGGVAVLGGLGGMRANDEMAAGPATDEDSVEGADARLFAEDDADDADGSEMEVLDEPQEEQAEPGAVAAAPEPAIIEAGTALDTDEDARDHLSALAATTSGGVLGLGLPEAEELAAAFGVALQRAAPFSSAVPPDRCLEEVTAGVDGPAVPIAVEALTFGGADALAYLVVTASSGSGELDRVDGLVVEPAACLTRLFTNASP